MITSMWLPIVLVFNANNPLSFPVAVDTSRQGASPIASAGRSGNLAGVQVLVQVGVLV